jgi:hypothetical protein
MSRVGQFFGKLFAGQGDKNEAVLRAYGKLPFYAEYRRLELAPGTPTTFSQWMDDGRLAWARSPSRNTSGAVRPSRLFIRLPETREAVVASIWDSRDSLGRVFPFAFFVVCPPEALGDDPFQCWVSAFAVYGAFERFHRELATLGRGGNFYRLYQKRTVVLRPEDLVQRSKRLRYEASEIVAADWFKAALGDVSVDAWSSGLRQRVQRWKSHASSASELAPRPGDGPRNASHALAGLARRAVPRRRQAPLGGNAGPGRLRPCVNAHPDPRPVAGRFPAFDDRRRPVRLRREPGPGAGSRPVADRLISLRFASRCPPCRPAAPLAHQARVLT